MAQQVKNLIGVHEDVASLPGLRIRCCCELWCRSRWGLGLALLWLWCRPAAVALLCPLAWERPYAVGAVLKRQKKKRKEMQRLKDGSWAVVQELC